MTIKRVLKGLCRRIGLYDKVDVVKVHRAVCTTDESMMGKNVLITGGSSGIGLAIANKIISCGGNVLVTGRDPAKLTSVKQADKSGRLMTMCWDITDMDKIPDKIDAVFTAFSGHVDVLVNNAGISIREKPGELTIDVWNKVLATNLTATLFVAQSVALKWMRMGVGGNILNVGSMAGLEPAVDAYSAAKCALHSMTKGMARTWAKDGIRVNAIAPGVVVGTNLRDVQRNTDPDGNIACKWIPFGRYAVPPEIAELAVFMISDRAAYMTGEVVSCDGAGSLRQ